LKTLLSVNKKADLLRGYGGNFGDALLNRVVIGDGGATENSGQAFAAVKNTPY